MANEKRLTDANEAKRRIIAFATGCHTEVLTVDSIIMLLNQSDTVDAVEVVRCEKCTFSKHNPCSGLTKCTSNRGLHRVVSPTEYCSWGERRVTE